MNKDGTRQRYNRMKTEMHEKSIMGTLMLTKAAQEACVSIIVVTMIENGHVLSDADGMTEKVMKDIADYAMENIEMWDHGDWTDALRIIRMIMHRARDVLLARINETKGTC